MEKVERMEGKIHIASGHQEKPSANHHEMPVDLFETDRYYVVHANLAGCMTENLNVSIHDDKLDVWGERSPGEEYANKVRRYHKQEIPSGTLWREIKLPVKLDSGQMTANFANGLLTVVVPKKGHEMGEHKDSGEEKAK